MEIKDLYPIGQQSFETIRKNGSYYVDKTSFVARIVNSSSNYYFLARPRRFGKSLFLDTIKCFFEGKRDLFKGLYIDSTNWDWQEYPVLKIDLNTKRYSEFSEFDNVLDNSFNEWENKYGIEFKAKDLSDRFKNIIAAAHEKTGLPVVILVDEYDKPLVNNLNKDDNFDWFRTRLASIYSNFKSSAEHIRLVFLTGVSRFSRLSVFSDLNNLNDITFDNAYADICGISEKELHHYFKEGIGRMAEFNGISYEETSAMLKKNYDGYRFAETGSDMYNPWSVLNALSKAKIANYWNQTGMPTIIAESLKRVNADLTKVLDVTCSQNDLVGMDLRSPKPIALMYQTGYLTIKDHNMQTNRYRLGIPNDEVKYGLMTVLIPYFTDSRPEGSDFDLDAFLADIQRGRPEEFMKRMESYFASMPFKLRIRSEHDVRNAIYVFISLLGVYVKAELETSDGAIDITIKTPENIYIIELKYNRSAKEAIDQIERKEYALPYAMDSRRVFLVGANFNPRKRRFDEIIVK